MRLLLDIGKKYPEITGPISDAFAADLRNAVGAGEYSVLVLDLRGTRTISSMTMGAIFSVYQQLKHEGRELEVINASEKVSHLLRMVNMGDILS
ncbi:MAG: STAS domain-containing protein [Planctomycetaceae bacterium]|nr:STAS domain-containing protein [Planctomycetaceae bacterium]